MQLSSKTRPLNATECKLATRLPSFDRFKTTAYTTEYGAAIFGDSEDLLRLVPDNSVDLIFTSPPFALRRKKRYGNETPDEYIAWFAKFAHHFHRVLKNSGSLVIEIGGSWNPGEPTKSLYHYRLLINLVDIIGFHLAQEVFWYNPARLPTPAQWVCRERVRLKDAVDMVWWLSKTPRPKADNRRVLTRYKANQQALINGTPYNAGLRPSEHLISDKFGTDNGGAIPPNFLDDDVLGSLIGVQENLIRAANTSSTDRYLKGCKEIKAVLHPARIPATLPDFFIRLLTEPGDLVLDPFAGSNVTGAVAEESGRNWLAMERDLDYLFASQTRFVEDATSLKHTFRMRRYEALKRLQVSGTKCLSCEGSKDLGTREI